MFKKEDVIAHSLSYPGVYEDRPFRDAETIAIRHAGNGKTFLFIIFAHGKLHINLKCDPPRADFFRQVYEGVVPGYHMNKMHWNSVFLDSDVPDEALTEMIGISYDLTCPRKKGRAK